MDTNRLDDVFHEQLREMYSTLHHLADILPTVIAHISVDELKDISQNYEEITQQELKDVQQLFMRIGLHPTRKEFDTVKYFMRETATVINNRLNLDERSFDERLIRLIYQARVDMIVTYENIVTWSQIFDGQEIAHTLHSLIETARALNQKLNEQFKKYAIMLDVD